MLNLAAWTARHTPARVRGWIYRVRPLARWIRGRLNRAAPRGLTVIEVAAGALAGFRLEIDLQTEKDYWLGTYEPEVQAALKTLVRPDMIVYDVGANIGYISLQLAKLAGARGRVYAFEALPENVARLKLNLELNDLADRVEVLGCAVLDSERLARFLVAPSGGMGKAEGSAGRQDVDYREAIEVPGVSLDGFVYVQEHPAPALVKMDIEGGEALALPGMRRLLLEVHPVMLIELHGPESAQAAWTALTGAGYHICRMQAGFPRVRSLADLDWKAYVAAFHGTVP